MPWNNQNGGGGWKGGGGNNGGPWGQGPWGQGGGGKPGGQPPDLEEILKRSQDRMKQVMPSGGPPGILMFLIFAIAAAVVGFYAFTFVVKPDELGVVLQFGKYERQEGPGLHFRLPYPIEEVLKPKVTQERRIEVGMQSAATTRGALTRDVPQESLMLTGDENIVDVDFVVVWRIKSEEKDEKTGQAGVEKYLFNIQNPVSTVKEVAESAMREVVGKRDIQPILTAERQKIELEVRDLMQQTLDSYDAGVYIVRVQMQKVDPPEKVIDAFRDVQAAKADQERIQNVARGYANKIVPEARGEAERILQAAEGYKQQTVQEALGQASRFEKVYGEYAKAPDITRKRMFLETMERVFKGTDKIILDSSGGGSGVVPYLPLDQLRKPAPAEQGGR